MSREHLKFNRYNTFKQIVRVIFNKIIKTLKIARIRDAFDCLILNKTLLVHLEDNLSKEF